MPKIVDLLVAFNACVGIGGFVARRLWISRRARNLLNIEDLEKELKIK